MVLGGFFCAFSQSETICNLHSCYRRTALLFSANQNWVIFSCILSSLLSYSEIHGAVVICDNRFSVIIFNLCIFFILPLTIVSIKTVLTKWFRFVCAGFVVNALHECCIVFICKSYWYCSDYKITVHDIRYHNDNKILERSCALYTKSNRISKSHIFVIVMINW